MRRLNARHRVHSGIGLAFRLQFQRQAHPRQHGPEQVGLVGEMPVDGARVTPAAAAMSDSEVRDTPRLLNTRSAASSSALRVFQGLVFGVTGHRNLLLTAIKYAVYLSLRPG